MTLFDNQDDWKKFLLIFFYAAIIATLLALFAGCKTIEYVPVPEVHHEYHYTTDSVYHTDSIIDHQTTIIREVDSATMAQYGIKLKEMERAWLVQNDRLYKEIERLKQSKSDTVLVHDSIPYPVKVPVEVKVPRDYTFKDKVLFKFAGFGIFCLALIIMYVAYRVIKNKITGH